MLILGINGSSNKEGNTAYMLSHALSVIKEEGVDVRLIHVVDALKGQKDPFCTLCTDNCEGACTKGKPLGEAYDLLRKADGIIIGSPVYFGTVSAQLKGFWDKSRVLRKEKALVNTIGGAFAVGGARFGGQETTVRAIQDMMFVQGMTVVGDGYIGDDAGHQGACAVRKAEDDDNGLKRAEILAKRVLEVAKATKELRS